MAIITISKDGGLKKDRMKRRNKKHFDLQYHIPAAKTAVKSIVEEAAIQSSITHLASLNARSRSVTLRRPKAMVYRSKLDCQQGGGGEVEHNE
jgi:hypothetical protein